VPFFLVILQTKDGAENEGVLISEISVSHHVYGIRACLLI
jgi:hypothetical protein